MLGGLSKNDAGEVYERGTKQPWAATEAKNGGRRGRRRNMQSGKSKMTERRAAGGKDAGLKRRRARNAGSTRKCTMDGIDDFNWHRGSQPFGLQKVADTRPWETVIGYLRYDRNVAGERGIIAFLASPADSVRRAGHFGRPRYSTPSLTKKARPLL